MPIQLRWLVDPAVSAFHAAEAVARGLSLADDRLAELLAQPVAQLQRRLTDAGVNHHTFWNHLVPQSAGIDSNRELASVALTKTVGNHDEQLPWRLSETFTEIESAIRQSQPEAVEIVTRSSAILRQAWDSKGKAVLDSIGQLTEDRLLVASAKVLLCYPALGGAGSAHLLYNSVRVEVIEEESQVEPMEIARLAWLLSQINMDVPALSETVHGHRLPLVASLSMLPPALIAAEQAGCPTFDEERLDQALDAWCPELESADGLAALVWRWWQTYLGRRPAWSVGVGALDQMLLESGELPSTQ